MSWYDRNSNYNNYFGNLSTGEWFKFVSRQVALDHVYVMTPSTVLNFRYGYNWFVRGTDSNPANHDFDLTSLGFPASYNSSIPDGIRRSRGSTSPAIRAPASAARSGRTRRSRSSRR